MRFDFRPFQIGTVITVMILQHAVQAPAADPPADSDAGSGRVRGGLQVFYDFSADQGATVKNRAGGGGSGDLQISEPGAVERSRGSLRVIGETRIQSGKTAGKLAESVRRSGEITIEAWIQPATVDQEGPARIVTFSAGSSQRNFTLGQDGDRYDVRLRTTQTGVNGIPSLSLEAGSVTTDLTHVVYTRDRTGRTRVYLDGEQVVEKTISGSTSGWEHFRIGIGNEIGGARPWLGTFRLVAIYSRDLLPNEVEQNFKAGPDAAAAADEIAVGEMTRGEYLFTHEIAPMFAKHCLECHDAATRKGKLDLSKKETAFAGGSGGPVIEPKSAENSYLFESVATDEMPADRTPLSAREKELLREWIDEGATWVFDEIDPAVYEHEARAAGTWLRRLTVDEYIETVRGALGVDIEWEARELLPKDLRADGFSNTAYNLNVDLEHVHAYSQLAELIVDRLDVLEFAAGFSKTLRFTDKEMGKLIGSMGKWLLRGPLEEHEIIGYRGISTTVASAGGDVEEAVRYMIEAMLQSPRFIYRVENQRGDGTAWPVGAYELASRLSYTIWGGPPDRRLMKAADDGTLFDAAELQGQVERMLDDPRAVRRSKQFIDEWLNLGHLENRRPDPERFPDWTESLAADMREETLAFFEDVVWDQGRPLSDLLNAQVTHATPRLARHYGLSAEGDGLARYDLSEVPARGGLLTQGSVLTVGGDEASMVTRGLFVLHDLLRGTVKDPPPGLDITPVPSSPGQSQRLIAEDRIQNQSCGGCHSKFEPLAFGLERFDGTGAYHETDRFGNALREDGEILFPGSAAAVPYKTSAELMDLLASNGRVKKTITWKLTQFALGRPLVAEDAPILDRIHENAVRDGGTYRATIAAIVTSDLFQMTRTEGTELTATH